ncbi:protein FAM133B-like isoform X1 [Sycon ciliatum]|uniref:protein FAM133B-like isoform X1 n=2 Tax=Sycon ciliatum TaxID=27933 RepID=UPI0031F69D0A
MGKRKHADAEEADLAMDIVVAAPSEGEPKKKKKKSKKARTCDTPEETTIADAAPVYAEADSTEGSKKKKKQKKEKNEKDSTSEEETRAAADAATVEDMDVPEPTAPKKKKKKSKHDTAQEVTEATSEETTETVEQDTEDATASDKKKKKKSKKTNVDKEDEEQTEAAERAEKKSKKKKKTKSKERAMEAESDSEDAGKDCTVQEEDKTSHGAPEKAEEQVQDTAWTAAEFDDTDRKAKFLKLMGGQKLAPGKPVLSLGGKKAFRPSLTDRINSAKSSSSAPSTLTLKANPNAPQVSTKSSSKSVVTHLDLAKKAVSKASTDKMNTALEDQFTSALHMRQQIKQGFGLGFSNKKFEIDAGAVRSKKF